MTAPSQSIYPILSPNKLGWLLKMDRKFLEDNASVAASFYKSFDIYKGKRADGSDKWRHIDNPGGDLRVIQDAIYSKLLKEAATALPPYLSGGMPGRSIIDNAYPHLGKPAVVTLDIQNCFPNIKHKRILEVWLNDLGCGNKVAAILTQLTTLQTRLPQGAPTSPVLCNFALAPLAEDIYAYTQQHNLTFTLYVDDTTISGEGNAVRAAIDELIPLVRRHGYLLSKGKIYIMDSNEMQKTTGLKINKSLTIPAAKLNEMRSEILRIEQQANQVKMYEVNRIWGQIQFYRTINREKGDKLFNFALDHIKNITGTYAPKPKDVTRSCKDYGNKH